MRKEFEHVRGDVDKFAEQYFHHACQMAVSVQIDPSYPRVTARQQHRANSPVSSPLKYYRRTWSSLCLMRLLVNLMPDLVSSAQLLVN